MPVLWMALVIYAVDFGWLVEEVWYCVSRDNSLSSEEKILKMFIQMFLERTWSVSQINIPVGNSWSNNI